MGNITETKSLAQSRAYRRWMRESGLQDCSVEEKRTWARGEMARLRAASLEALQTPEGWAAYLEACIRTDRYSWRNVALISYQAPGFRAVQTFNGWKGQGLRVKPGPIRITGKGPKGFITIKLFEDGQTDAPLDWYESHGLTEDVTEDVGKLWEAFPMPTSDDDAKTRADAARRATL